MPISNSFLPEQMTTEQRRMEIAALLATGLCRLRDISTPVHPEQGLVLDCGAHPSVHRHRVNPTNQESR